MKRLIKNRFKLIKVIDTTQGTKKVMKHEEKIIIDARAQPWLDGSPQLLRRIIYNIASDSFLMYNINNHKNNFA